MTKLVNEIFSPVGCLVLFYIFSSAVSSMSAITSDSSTMYKWAYRFLHALAADWSKFFPKA